MNLLFPWLFVPFKESSYSSYLMISLHLLHCVFQSFKRRTILWVFPPTVKHNLIANRENILPITTSLAELGEGPGPRLFLAEFKLPGGPINIFDRAGPSLILGSGWAGAPLIPEDLNTQKQLRKPYGLGMAKLLELNPYWYIFFSFLRTFFSLLVL